MAERRVVIAKCPVCDHRTWFSAHWYLSYPPNPVRCFACHKADYELTPILLDSTGRGEPLHKSTSPDPGEKE